jgi:hypothetical protein
VQRISTWLGIWSWPAMLERYFVLQHKYWTSHKKVHFIVLIFVSSYELYIFARPKNNSSAAEEEIASQFPTERREF